MQIRTLKTGEREALLDLLDGWDVGDGWRGRDFFRRYLEDDPTFVDENVWVVAEGERLDACVQVFPRHLRVLAHAVPTGGIGSVYSRPEVREGGLASQLLDRAASAMRERGMELSLLFTGRTAFYEKRGWRPWPSERMLLRPGARVDDVAGPDIVKPDIVKPDSVKPDIVLRPFEAPRDLEAVRAVHAAYSRDRNGMVVRDGALWRAGLVLAGNPGEEFLVACRGGPGGEVCAYIRATCLYSVYTVTELGRLPDTEAASALAELAAGLLAPRDPDPMAPPGQTSSELRASVLLPSFDDLALTVGIEQRGVKSHPFADPSLMLRCLDAAAFGARLDVELEDGESAEAYLGRILPPEHFVFWPADRF